MNFRIFDIDIVEIAEIFEIVYIVDIVEGVTAIWLFYDPFSQFGPQLELYSELQHSLSCS